MMLARSTTSGLLLTLVLCGGCVHSPYGMSLDRHNYTSTPHMPLTLSLVDTITGDTVWTVDVPVYKKVVVDLDHDQSWTTAQSPAIRADEIRWGIFEPNQRFGVLSEEQKLSGNPVLLKVTIRESESVEMTNTSS